MRRLQRTTTTLVLLFLCWHTPCAASGQPEATQGPPSRVVSLVPAVTELLFAMGAGEALVGVTLHDLQPAEVHGKVVVGGFFAPSVDRIEALDPDLIIVSDLHQEVRDHFADRVAILDMPADSLEQAFARMEGLGALFGRGEAARALVMRNREQLALLAAKVAGIPEERRPRAMRLMGVEPLSAPGDDSFQNEFIRAAGGGPPQFGRQGNVIGLAPEEIAAFDPEVIYVCGDSQREKVLARADLAGVTAVRRGRVFSFPCDLTCRAGAHVGDFVSWLAARLHEERFADPALQVAADRVLASRPLELDLPVVARARVVESRIRDFGNKTLLIEFSSPQRLLSTLEGERSGITAAGNHYYPPPSWGLGHATGLDGLRQTVLAALGRQVNDTSLLFTGADMDHLAVVEKSHREMRVVALVTAGVHSNAMRMGVDEGGFYEPGTINVVLMSNMRLSPRAMTRAIITATEAKSAALNDLDIRSTFTPRVAATGTGTDNVLVVEGQGAGIDNSGGHTKMGELIAAAVYDGVRRAIAGQNGIVAHRSIFARLKERRLALWTVAASAPENCALDRAGLARALEELLLEPEYAGFLTQALAADDAYQAGRDAGREAFAFWAEKVAADLASGREVAWKAGQAGEEAPPLDLAFAALVNGICLGR